MWRVPSDEIEQRIRHLVGVMLADQAGVVDAAQRADYSALRLPRLLAGLEGLASDWAAMVRRVELRRSEIRLMLAVSSEPEVSMARRFPMQMRRRGVEMRLVVASKTPEVRRDPDLVKRLGQAVRWWQLISTGQVDTVAAIARAEGLDQIYVGRVLPLALLAPDIVEAIVKGEQPAGLNAVKIMRGHGDGLPLAWSDQRHFLGFESRISR